jgi:hypothetical protein
MRVYLPSGHGLGAPEISALRRLSPRALAIVAEEIHEPGSRETVKWILGQQDPEQALAEAISENVRQATSQIAMNPDAGFGEFGELGKKSFFKKLVSIHRKVFNAIKKVNAKIAKIDPIYKATAKIRKKVMVVVRKFAPIIITVAGAVLAPFTGGASMAAAAVLSTAYELRKKKIEAAKALKAGKQEAAGMQAQVDAQTAQVMKQADDVYSQNSDIFLSAGYTQDKWNALTLDQKIDLIQQASAGKLVPTAEAIAAQQAAAQQVSQTVSQVGSFVAGQQAAGAPSTTGSSGGGGGAPGGDGYQGDQQADSGQPSEGAAQAPSTTGTTPKPETSGGISPLWFGAAIAAAYVATKK